MNRERTIELARKCYLTGIMVTDGVYIEALERFANLVRAEALREAVDYIQTNKPCEPAFVLRHMAEEVEK